MKKVLAIGLSCVTFASHSDTLTSIIHIDRKSERVSVESVYGDMHCNTSASTHDVVFLSPTQSITLATLVDCGGGNHYDSYLILANKGINRWNVVDQIAVGDDRTFAATSVEVNNNIIEVHGKIWRHNDGHCCPSGLATKRFTIKDSLIKEKLN